MAIILGVAKRDGAGDLGGSEDPGSHVAPFDECHRRVLHHFGDGEVVGLSARANPIEVGVEKLRNPPLAVGVVGGHHGEGRTGHSTFDAQPCGHALGERRLARSEAAREHQHRSGH